MEDLRQAEMRNEKCHKMQRNKEKQLRKEPNIVLKTRFLWKFKS